MTKRYNRERIHKLFLEENGDIRAVMRHRNTPSSAKTILKYAKEGDWYKELTEKNKKENDRQSPENNHINNKDSDCILEDKKNEIKNLEHLRAIIYNFLVPNGNTLFDAMKLKPKTYTEAVKCYLEVDSRLDEKRRGNQNFGINKWEEIIRRCAMNSEDDERGSE